VLLSQLINITAHAKDYFGVSNISDKKTVEGTELTLNGVGLRKATFVKIKVYAGALYTTAKVSSDSDIEKVKLPAHIDMHFVRNVDKADIIKAWEVAFKNTHKSQVSQYRKDLDTLNSMMSDIKKGSVMSFTFLDNKVIANVPGQSQKEITSANFARALLLIWFKDAEDRGLRAGMLSIPE
jgi:hypothetical protein